MLDFTTVYISKIQRNMYVPNMKKKVHTKIKAWKEMIPNIQVNVK